MIVKAYDGHNPPANPAWMQDDEVIKGKGTVAHFENLASGEYISTHFNSLLLSGEMEFLYRLQTNECLRYGERRVSFKEDRPWLKQLRRTVDISNLGRQDETWTFEVDWSVLQNIAQDCWLERFQEGESVPLPLLLIRRYVATDYNCLTKSNDGSSYLTHRKANNAFAALVASYFLSARISSLHKPPYPSDEIRVEVFHVPGSSFRQGCAACSCPRQVPRHGAEHSERYRTVQLIALEW
ncbi:hypothetical protein [Bifidobacterium aesculapii]|uniref:hypothetical protein n=1 Tax=Bifidobacterium aesculapii TaxID=1329411 RepID=UPI00128F3E2A|nr:hypothetical protein [Bifidobacterium aesculapii]